MATDSSILAWRIPWTEEPDGLQSMGSQRVGHDWVTFTLSDYHSLTHSHPVHWFFWRSSLQQSYCRHNIIFLLFILIYLFGCTGIFIAVCGIFSCSTWDLVPCPRIKPRHAALGSWSLSHWTTREVSTFWIKQLSSSLVGEAGNIKKSEPQK